MQIANDPNDIDFDMTACIQNITQTLGSPNWLHGLQTFHAAADALFLINQVQGAFTWHTFNIKTLNPYIKTLNPYRCRARSHARGLAHRALATAACSPPTCNRPPPPPSPLPLSPSPLSLSRPRRQFLFLIFPLFSLCFPAQLRRKPRHSNCKHDAAHPPLPQRRRRPWHVRARQGPTSVRETALTSVCFCNIWTGIARACTAWATLRATGASQLTSTVLLWTGAYSISSHIQPFFPFVFSAAATASPFSLLALLFAACFPPTTPLRVGC